MQNTALNQLFAKEVQKRIFENNEFLDHIKNVSEYLNYRTVNIPNYTTAAASVVINGSSFDYNDFTQTAETFVSFNIDSFRLKPIQIENFEELVTSYDKFELVTSEKMAELADQVAKRILWVLASDVSSSTRKIKTTGTIGTGNSANLAGNKKALSFADIARLKSVMDGDALTQQNRWLIVDNIQYSELLQDDNIVKYMNFGVATAPQGNIDTLLGFNILMKPTIATASSTGSVLGWGAAVNNNNYSRVALAFHADIPLRAHSDVKVYSQSDVAQLYGSIISCEIFMGVKNPRSDGKGVYIIYQGAAGV